MDHPQPAFNLLTSLPVDRPIRECILVDWHILVDAEKGDRVENHPEIWEEFELPDVLAELSTDDLVNLQPFRGKLNLNAIAIGLGLEDIKYEPETFPGLVYDFEEYEATALVFRESILFAVGETEDATSDALETVLDRIETLGLGDDIELDADRQTLRVSEIIHQE